MSVDYSALATVRKDPTESEWRLVLTRLVHGEFDGYLDRIGSVDEFVRINIGESMDRARSQAAFGQALEQLVSGWQASERRPLHETERMLQLISAFTPANGFHKVLGQLERYGYFLVEPGDTEHKRVLLHRALIALQNYYPVPPAGEKDVGFKAYAAYLWGIVSKADDHTNLELAPHACRRLLQLHQLEFGAAEVLWLAERRPEEFFREVLVSLFCTRHSQTAAWISGLYRTCLLAEKSAELNVVLEELGARIDHAVPPRLVTSNGEVIGLSITPDIAVRYYKVRSHEGARRGNKALRALAERTPKWAQQTKRRTRLSGS